MAAARRASTGEWPFVGRAAPVAAADEVLAANGRVVVCGREGVGKTRVLAALADRAAARGCRVERATGSIAARDIPFGALAHLVPGNVLDTWRDELLKVMVGMLRDGHRDHRTLMVVDDAHLLDPGSATLVAHLARGGPDAPAIALGVRVGERCPDAIVGLWKDGVATRLDLAPLAEPDVAELVAAALGGSVDRATARRLHTVTQGNALYLRELVQEGRQRDVLTRVNGVWRWDGEMALSPALRDLIAARLDQLDAQQRGALEAVAVGEPITVDALERVVDPLVLDVLEERGLLVVGTEGTAVVARVGHPLYGEVLRRSGQRRRTDRIRVVLADAIDASGGDPLRSAALRLDAGAPPDPARLVAAAQRAWALNDTALVRRLASAALAVGPDLEAEHLLAGAAGNDGRWDEAVAGWRRVLAGDPGDDLRARAAVAAAMALAMPLGRPDEARAVLAAGESALAGSAAGARLAATRVALFGDVPTKLAAGGQLDEVAPDEIDEAQLWTWTAAGVARLRHGDLERLIEESGPMLELAGRQGDWLAALYVGLCRFFGYLLAGRMDECEAFCRGRYERTLDDPLPLARATWAHALGKTALHAGRLDAARVNLHESIALLHANDNGTLRLVLHELAMVEALAGDAVTATALVGRAAGAARGLQEPFVEADRIEAAIRAGAGRLGEARALLTTAAQRARAEDDPFYEIPALHDLARYGGAPAATARLAELAAAFDGDAVRAHAEQCRAIEEGDATALLAVAGRYGGMGLFLDAAESAAAAVALARRDSHAALATRAERAQQEWTVRCGGTRPRTPLLGGGAVRSPLTEREAEVAELAGKGFTDPEIAARLFLSVRTVNAHLRSIYTKLGVSGRKDLRPDPT